LLCQPIRALTSITKKMADTKTPLLSAAGSANKAEDVYDQGSNFSGHNLENGIFYRHWSVPSGTKARAVLFVFHGVHEHSGRYADFGNKCASAGFDVFAIDHFGHGRSPGYTEGAEGDVGEKGFFDGVVANAVDLVNIESAGKDLPVFIFGHSMGSMCAFLTAHTLATNASMPTPKGVVLSGFAMNPGPASNSPFGLACLGCIVYCCDGVFARAIARLTAKLAPLAPNSPLDVSKTTRDKKMVMKTTLDQLHFGGPIRNRTASACLAAGLKCKNLATMWGEGNFPALIVHGEDDSVTLPSGSQFLFDHIPQKDKELILYPGCYHELLMELEDDRAKATKDILQWMENHLVENEDNSSKNII
jgi:acylglycerol lipase